MMREGNENKCLLLQKAAASLIRQKTVLLIFITITRRDMTRVIRYGKDTNQKMVNGLRNGFSVRENLRQVPGAEDVPQRGGGKKPGGPVG